MQRVKNFDAAEFGRRRRHAGRVLDQSRMLRLASHRANGSICAATQVRTRA